MTQQSLAGFISNLALPDDAKSRLLALAPSTYVGLAAELAKRI
jgi:adenylosuccinate lyase